MRLAALDYRSLDCRRLSADRQHDPGRNTTQSRKDTGPHALSIANDPGGRRRILFVAADGKRKTIRLEQGIAARPRRGGPGSESRPSTPHAQISKCPLDGDTAAWVRQIAGELADKLAAVGLIPKRQSARLEDFLAGYIKSRTDVKPNTTINLELCKVRLVEFFGAEKGLDAITEGDADAWLLWLKEHVTARDRTAE